MKIKQLKWKEYKSLVSKDGYLQAIAIEDTGYGGFILGYRVYSPESQPNKYTYHYADEENLYCSTGYYSLFNSIEEAKSAAQEHFERVINNCIELYL